MILDGPKEQPIRSGELSTECPYSISVQLISPNETSCLYRVIKAVDVKQGNIVYFEDGISAVKSLTRSANSFDCVIEFFGERKALRGREGMNVSVLVGS